MVALNTKQLNLATVFSCRQRESMNPPIMKFLSSLISWLEFLEGACKLFLVFDQHCCILETLSIKQIKW